MMQRLDRFMGKERRTYVRLDTKLTVEFRINGETGDTPWHQGTTKNISMQGICLVTDLFSKEKWEEMVKKKRHLYLRIGVPQLKEKINARAKVVQIEVEVAWHRGETKKEARTIFYIGLEFSKIERDSMVIIRRYILDNLITKYRAI